MKTRYEMSVSASCTLLCGYQGGTKVAEGAMMISKVFDKTPYFDFMSRALDCTIQAQDYERRARRFKKNGNSIVQLRKYQCTMVE